MAPEKLTFRIPVYEVLIVSVITIVPISLAGLYSLSQSDQSLHQAIGNDFSALAGSTAAGVSQSIRERVAEVGRLATAPLLVDSIVAANKGYTGMKEAAISGEIEKIDRAWNVVPTEPTVNQIPASRLSVWLRTFRDFDSRMLRITVTNEKGAAIAFTHKPMRYSQADDESWQSIYADGNGAISLTDIGYDEVTKSDYIGVGWPVREEGSGRFIGAVNALMDISAISSLGTRAAASEGRRILLVKDDGTVIAAPQVTFAQRVQSPEYAALRDAKGTLAARQTGYIVATFSGDQSLLIGFADTGLNDEYPALNWVVLVCQDTQQAFGSVRLVGRMIALVSVVGLVMASLLLAYFAMHRKEPYTDLSDLAEEPVAPASREPGVPEAQ